MTSDLAACLARLAAELASDSIQLSAASPTSSRSTWRSLTTRTRSSTDPPTLSLSVERRLQRFTTLDEFRRALLNASSHDIHQIQEVAINTIMTNAFVLGDTLAFRAGIAQCFVLLLSRSEARFTDDALGRMLDSIGSSASNPIQALPVYISTTLECINQISKQYPSRISPFYSLLTKAVKRLVKSANANVRVSALQCLYNALPSDTLTSDLAKIIAKAITDRSSEVRAAAAACIPKLPNPIATLIQLLDDPEPEVQQAAVNAFSDVTLTYDTAISKLMPLKPLLEKGRSNTINALIQSLNKISVPGQASTFANELLIQLLEPTDINSAHISSTILTRGLLLHSDSLTRSNVLKSLLQLAGQKAVTPWILSSCLDAAFAAIQLLGGELTSDLEDSLLELLLSALSNPIAHIRLQSASTLQQLAKNRPSQTTIILRILQNVAAIHIAETTISVHDTRDMGTALTSMHGHCHALAALTSIVNSIDSGIPDAIISDLFKTATNLAASYKGDVRINPALTMVCAESAWVLIDALLLQGVNSSQLCETLFPLWKAYLKTDREAHSFAQTVAIASSNATAIITHAVAAIHIRRWALTALRTLVKCAGSVTLEDRTQVFKPIAAILNEAMIVAEAVKSVRDSALDDVLIHTEFQAFKAILLDVFACLPVNMFQSRHIPLLHLCVSEFTWRYAPISRKLETNLSTTDYVLGIDRDEIIFGEYFIGPNAQSQPSLCSLSNDDAVWSNSFDELLPKYRFLHRFALFPSAQRAVDASIRTFASIFKLQQPQHQIQLLTHFHSIQSQLEDPQQVTNPVYNITAALLCTLQNLVRSHHVSADIAVRSVLVTLLKSLSNSPCGLVRRGACECLGLLCRLEDSTFTSEMMNDQRQVLQSNTQQSALSVTSSIFTMVNIHRHVGVIGTIQYLPFTIMALQTLFEHTVEPLRTYVLHSLWCLVDISGTNFSPYARSSLDLVLLQILSDQQNIPKSLNKIIARLIRSLLEILGPELNQDPGPLRKCEWLWRSSAADAASESVEAIQQFIFWSTESVNNLHLISKLKSYLQSPSDSDVILALVSCIKQIGMKDYNLVIEHGFDIGLLNLLDCETDPNIQKHISNALETIVIVSNAPDRWLDFAKVVLVNGRLPLVQPTQAELPADSLNEPGGQVSPVSWRTIACVTSCLVLLIDSSNDFVKRVRDVVNLVCRAVGSTDDAIRAAGLHGLGAVLRKYSALRDPVSPEDSLLQWDLPQIKAAIRSAMVMESSPSVKEPASVSCAELLISDLMSNDDVATRRFLDLLSGPLSNMGQQLISNFSNRVVFYILCSHLAALSRVVLARTLRDQDLMARLRRLLIAVLQDRLIICGIHDIRSCTSRLFSPVFLSRNMYERDWALYMRCLSKISGGDHVAIRTVIGVVLQYQNMYLETVSNQDSEHEPEMIAEWGLQSISAIYTSDSCIDVNFTSHILSSLSVISETCSLNRLLDVVTGTISIVKSLQRCLNIPDTVSGSLRKIVRLAFIRCLGSSVVNVDLLNSCLDLVQSCISNQSLCPQDVHTISTWAKYSMQSIHKSSKSSYILHSIIDFCVAKSEPGFDQIIEAINMDSFQVIDNEDIYDPNNRTATTSIIETLLCTVCTRKSFQLEMINFIINCLRSDPTSIRFTRGLRLAEGMLKYPDSRFQYVLLSIAPILIQVTSSYQTALSMSLIAAITIMIEQISIQPGRFLSTVIIPFYLKLDHPDTQSYVTLFVSVIGSHVRDAVQSLSSEDKIVFQRCLERSSAARSTLTTTTASSLSVQSADKKSTKKSKVKKVKPVESNMEQVPAFSWNDE